MRKQHYTINLTYYGDSNSFSLVGVQQLDGGSLMFELEEHSPLSKLHSALSECAGTLQLLMTDGPSSS